MLSLDSELQRNNDLLDQFSEPERIVECEKIPFVNYGAVWQLLCDRDDDNLVFSLIKQGICFRILDIVLLLFV